MKKILLITSTIILLPQLLQGQSAIDALRFSRNFYTGTARSASMGNAFTALGGDFGSLAINPAGSAVYPYSEFIITPILNSSLTKSDYLSVNSNENFNRFGISNVGYISSLRLSNYSGLTGISFGIGYNSLNNFTNRLSTTGTTAQSSWLASLAYNTNGYNAKDLDWNEFQNPFNSSSAPWRSILAWNSSLLDTIPGSRGQFYTGATEALVGNNISIPGELRQDFFSQTVGNVGEYVINFGLNFSNRFFVGLNVGIQSIYYETNEHYSESVVNENEFWRTQFSSFTHTYKQTTTGVGVNAKFGMIFLPVKNLRLGATISSPTLMRLRDEWDEGITARFSDGYFQSLKSPLGTFDYKVNTPFKWSVGMAYTLSSHGAISIDYEQVNFKKTSMASTESFNPFIDENSYMKKMFSNASNIRAGLEINVSNLLSLRGGYAFYGKPEIHYGSHTQIASVGLGIHLGSFFSDLAFMQQLPQKEHFSLYDDVIEGSQVVYAAPVGTQTSSIWKLLLSLGFRF